MASNGCAGSSPARGTSSMKKLAYSIISFITLILTSCGASSGHFKLEGRFLHLNQGELYVYSLEGNLDGIDTIKVEGGRFAYEIPCDGPTTLMLVFPNFSEQPVFADAGKSVEIKADASHLKELKVEGTKDNKLMNTFREMILNVSPPEERKLAEQFIKDHPESPVSVFLVRKYFIMSSTPSYDKALALMDVMLKEQPKNGTLVRLRKQVSEVKDAVIGNTLPAFTAKDIDGKTVSSKSLNDAPILVITTWANWNFESKNIQRQLRKIQKERKGDLRLMSICVDASVADCKKAVEQDSLQWPIICTGDMLEDNTLRKLGLSSIPDNLVLHKGRIVARSLTLQELKDKIKNL